MRGIFPALISCLMPIVGLGADGPRDAESRYRELCKEFNDAQKDAVGAIYRARTPKMDREAMGLMPSVPEFSRKFYEVARESPGSDAALNAIFWILTYAPGGQEAEEGLKLLARNHLDDVRLAGPLVGLVEWPTRALEDLLRAAKDTSKAPEVKAHATLALAKMVAARVRREAAAGSGAAPYEEARSLFQSLGADHGDVKIPGPKTYRTLSREGLDKLGAKPRDGAPALEEGIEVGQKAPEIDSPNVKGQRMRLSESDGSVRVLSFWGHWCPYCREIYPFARSLKYRFGDKPVLLLGVNSDGSPEVLRQALANEEITFPNWWDGSHGPIAASYKVAQFPTTFVVDHKGIIRYKLAGVADENSIARAVDALLAERCSTRIRSRS